MITTDSVRKFFLPEQKREIDTYITKRMSQETRLGGVFKQITEPTVYTEYHQPESQAQATLRLEGTPPEEMRVVDGYSLRVFKRTWSVRLKWTEEARRYKQVDIMASAARQMMIAPENTVVALCIALLEYGNSTSGIPVVGGLPLVATQTIDKNPIFYTAHTFLNSPGVTNSNYLATGSVDETGIRTITDLPYTWKDPNGAPLNAKVIRLVVPATQRGNAYVMLGSEWTPDSGNNRINSIGQDLGPMDFVCLQDLNLSNTIYGLTDSRAMPPTIDWGWKPTTVQGTDTNINAEMLTLSFGVSVECADWTSIIRMGTT